MMFFFSEDVVQVIQKVVTLESHIWDIKRSSVYVRETTVTVLLTH